jgi:FkbM family methyltransferase
VSALSRGLAGWFLRYAAPLSGLRRIPVIGPVLSWTGRKLVPRDTLTWIQVQHGPAQGMWLRVNPRTGRDVLEGLGEPAVQATLQQQLRAGMVFYDLGANIGFFSLLAAQLVGSTGRVVSFEADPEIAGRLQENVARNNLLNVTVEQKAVWSEARTVSFARVDAATSPDRGLGHVTAEAAEENAIHVEAVSLDEYTRTAPAPDFLKCDVEGAEVEVFRGAARLLGEKRPGILCEMHSEANRQRLTEEFLRLGYSCKLIDENHVLALPQ